MGFPSSSKSPYSETIFSLFEEKFAVRFHDTSLFLIISYEISVSKPELFVSPAL